MKNRSRIATIVGVALGLACLALTVFAFFYVLSGHHFSRWGGIHRGGPHFFYWREWKRSEGKGGATATEEPGTEDRTVEPFRSVNLRGTGNVHITLGSPQSVTVKTAPGMTTAVITEVRGGELLIREKGYSGIAAPFDIYLTMEKAETLTVSGSGRIIGESTIEAGKLGLNILGSGNIAANVKAEGIKTMIAGSGRLTISGSAASHEASISGSGRIEGFGLETERSEVKVSGSGRAMLNVSRELDAIITGSGDIEYRGNPKVRQRITGSGEVRPGG